MSRTKRKMYSADFKAKVAREGLKEDATIVDISARYAIHPNQVGEWKKHAIEGLSRASYRKHIPISR